jgi:hypothetical protein
MIDGKKAREKRKEKRKRMGKGIIGKKALAKTL